MSKVIGVTTFKESCDELKNGDFLLCSNLILVPDGHRTLFMEHVAAWLRRFDYVFICVFLFFVYVRANDRKSFNYHITIGPIRILDLSSSPDFNHRYSSTFGANNLKSVRCKIFVDDANTHFNVDFTVDLCLN